MLQFHGVATHHCTIVQESGQWRIEAHSPMTWLNDDPVRAATLRNGDRLVIGPVQLRVVFDKAPAIDAEGTDTPHSDSIFDDEDELQQRSDRSDQAQADASASAESHIISSHDTVVLDRNRLALDLASLNSQATVTDERRPSAVAAPSATRLAAAEVVPPAVEVPPVRIVATPDAVTQREPRQVADDLVLERSRLYDLRKHLDERCRLMDERELELNELYSEVSTRRSQLLEKQQHWEVLCRSTAVPDSYEETEQADRRALAARQLAEQQEMLEALRRELHLRDTAGRDARKRIAELEDRLEVLQLNETLQDRGSLEFDVLAQMLERESQAVEQRREELRAAEQQALAMTAELEKRRHEQSAASVELDQELEGIKRRQTELESLSLRLAERDQQLTQVEFSLTGRVGALDQREVVIAEREKELTERLQAIAQLHLDIEARSKELDALRCTLTTELRDAHQLQQTLKDWEDRITVERDQLRQSRVDLQAAEETLRNRESVLREHDARIGQSNAALSLRERELAQHFESLESRKTELRHRELSAANAQQQCAELLQRQAELDASGAELDRLRQEFPTEHVSWTEDLHRQREELRQRCEEFETDRKSREQDLIRGFEQLGAQVAELSERQQEFTRLREERDRQETEDAGRTASPDATVVDPDLRQQELEAWHQRLSLVEQTLLERSQELDRAAERIEEQQRELELSWSSNGTPPSDQQFAERDWQPSEASSTHLQERAAALAFETAEQQQTSVLEPAEELEPEVREVHTLRNQLAEMFGIQAQDLVETQRATTTETENAPVGDELAATDSVDTANAEVNSISSHTAVAHTDSHAHDSVEGYWKRLLERNREEQSRDESEKSVPPAMRQQAASEVNDSAPEAHSAPAVIVSTWPDGEQRGPTLDQDERDALRAHMSSLRAVANHSARSAVAKHMGRQMMIQYHAKGVITLISGVVCIVMLTSPVWSNVLYIWQGFAALLITGFMATLLWRDYRKLQAAECSVGSTDEGDVQDAAAMSESPTDDRCEKPAPAGAAVIPMLTGLFAKREQR